MPKPKSIALVLALLAAAAAYPLGSRLRPGPPAGPPGATSPLTTPPPVAPPPPALARKVPLRREGQALVRAESEDALYLADEDHRQLRRLALTPALTTVPEGALVQRQKRTVLDDREPPLSLETRDVEVPTSSLALPGPPAQLVSLGDRLLVTVRDPGLLLVVSAGPAPRELGRAPLPYDAWGLAVSADGQTAYVTSAWSHQLSRVDVSGDTPRVVWSIPTEREPRGVTVTPDGQRVHVSHLIGAELTSVDVAGEPRAERVALPPDPLATLSGEKLSASLGYAAVLSPEGSRLFVARHALGSFWAWQGRTTVDVLATATNQPLAPVRQGRPYGQLTQPLLDQMGWLTDRSGTRAEGDGTVWVQPRAMIYRQKTRHLLVASEGMAVLAELDAMSVAPGLITNRVYRLGGLPTERLPRMTFPPRCGAPTGVALSTDEDVAWVYCRSTDNVVAVRLTPDGERAHRSEISYVASDAFHERISPWGPFAYAALDVPASDPALALGRRLYFDATDEVVSGQMGCAGCHPDGRDDGHVWREQETSLLRDRTRRFLAGPSLSLNPNNDQPQNYGMARQTPMLAGRVKADGPYGWHAESATLVDRLKAGFGLHRRGDFPSDGATMRMRIDPLIRYLREGLVSPPPLARPLSPLEAQGQQVFLSDKTRCATCHRPGDGEYTDRSLMPMLGYRTLPLYTEDPDYNYKTPSLRHVSGTAPYFHDGSARTLTELVARNQDRMGKTSHLSEQERAALVAFLETL